MNRRGAAEGDAGRTRSANDTETCRNAGRGDGGAASAASSSGNATGPGQGLIEQMIARENLNRAWKKVRANKGSAGVDGLDIETTQGWLREHWPGIEARLQAATYRSDAVRRVEIPKAGGGTRGARALRVAAQGLHHPKNELGESCRRMRGKLNRAS